MVEKRVPQSSSVDFATNYACPTTGLGVPCPPSTHDRWTSDLWSWDVSLLTALPRSCRSGLLQTLNLSEKAIFLL